MRDFILTTEKSKIKVWGTRLWAWQYRTRKAIGRWIALYFYTNENNLKQPLR